VSCCISRLIPHKCSSHKTRNADGRIRNEARESRRMDNLIFFIFRPICLKLCPLIRFGTSAAVNRTAGIISLFALTLPKLNNSFIIPTVETVVTIVSRRSEGLNRVNIFPDRLAGFAVGVQFKVQEFAGIEVI
jgi:hypothetical protein